MKLATGFSEISRSAFLFWHWDNKVRQGLINSGLGILTTTWFFDTRPLGFNSRSQTQRSVALPQTEMAATGARHYESFLDHNNQQHGYLDFDPNGRRIQRFGR